MVWAETMAVNRGSRNVMEKLAMTLTDTIPQTDPGLLARYVTTFAYGIAVQAASCVGRDELQELADAALRNWPLF